MSRPLGGYFSNMVRRSTVVAPSFGVVIVVGGAGAFAYLYENEQDAWFCGFVPQLAACFWIGYPRAEIPLHDVEEVPDVYCGSISAEIWHDFMTNARNPPVSVGMTTTRFPLELLTRAVKRAGSERDQVWAAVPDWGPEMDRA